LTRGFRSGLEPVDLGEVDVDGEGDAQFELVVVDAHQAVRSGRPVELVDIDLGQPVTAHFHAPEVPNTGLGIELRLSFAITLRGTRRDDLDGQYDIVDLVGRLEA